jgi:aminodeoxyfutalosine deaminase
VRPATLLEIARRNDYALPAETEEGLADLYDFRDFAHFIEVWILTTNALRTEEGLLAGGRRLRGRSRLARRRLPRGNLLAGERVRRGVAWDAIFSGYCDGAQQARELHGVEVRPDTRHRARLPARGRRGGRALFGEVPRARDRRRRPGRARG